MKHGSSAALGMAVALWASVATAQTAPSMVLEGLGTLGPASTCSGAEKTCSGQFNATLSGKLAQQVSSQALQLDFQIYNEPLDATGALRKIRRLDDPLKQIEEQIQALKREIRTLRAAGGAAAPDEDTPFGCYRATGTGTFQGSAFTVGFEGRFCAFSSSQVELSGTVRIVEAPPSTAPGTWGSGTLTASGALHTFSFGPDGANPIPGSGAMVVSVAGAAGEVPSLNP